LRVAEPNPVLRLTIFFKDGASHTFLANEFNIDAPPAADQDANVSYRYSYRVGIPDQMVPLYLKLSEVAHIQVEPV
jgi:hypothetical protein